MNGSSSSLGLEILFRKLSSLLPAPHSLLLALTALRFALGFFTLCSLLLAPRFLAEAQQPTKVPRIGVLSATSPVNSPGRLRAFRLGLEQLGYVEDKSIIIESRFAEGKLDRLPSLANELVALNVEVIVSTAAAATLAARQTTAKIPIVMTVDGDPIGSGHIASLARPGGNVTGVSTVAPEISGKRLELLKEIVPKLTHVAVLGTAINPVNSQQLKEVELAAEVLKLQLRYLDIGDPKTDLENAFRAAAREHSEAVLVLVSSVLNLHRRQIAQLAIKSRLPAIYYVAEWVDDGGLISYGPNFNDGFRRAATYVDKILKGAKPADLPVEQPKKFELVISLKAAKSINLTIPPNVLARADRIIK